jgi:hypothetical protein
MERSLGKRVQVIPNSSGGLPGDVFVDHLGVPLVWIPHSYNGCKQHGPDEHYLIAPAREGIARSPASGGIWAKPGRPDACTLDDREPHRPARTTPNSAGCMSPTTATSPSARPRASAASPSSPTGPT